jgi:hypothetical protein
MLKALRISDTVRDWRLFSVDRAGQAGLVIVMLYLIATAALTKTGPKSWNDRSHIAAIESFVERGTWAIDDSPWEDETKDKISLDGHFYSDKMPLLSLVGASVYAILHYAMDGSLAPNCSTVGKFCAYGILTFAVVGIPAALMLWLFLDFGSRMSVPLWAALIGTVALAFTMVFPYSLVFNHHLPAAVSLFGSYWVLTTRGAGSRRSMMVAGFFAALALSFDPLSGVMVAALFVSALIRNRFRVCYMIMGAAVPLALTVLLDYQITQTVFPPYLVPHGFAYDGSAFPETVGGNGAPDDYGTNTFRMFVGGKGLFAYNPLLLFALAGATGVLRNRRHPLWLEGWGVVLGFVVLCIYLATGTRDFAGPSYGERWFISIVPLLFSFIFFTSPLGASAGKSAAWILFVPLLGLSIFSSIQGAQSPWIDWPPPIQMIRFREAPDVIGIRWNVRFP